MAHSFLEYQGRSLLLHDHDILVVTAVVARVAERDEAEFPEAVRRGLAWWRLIGDACFPGALEPKLDEYFGDERSARVLVQLLDRATEHLQGFGAVVPGGRLTELLGENGPECFDRDTKDILLPFARERDFVTASPRSERA